MMQQSQNPDVQISSSAGAKPKVSSTAVGLLCLGLAGGMVGLSYAAVPLYQLFCQITGYGGTTQRAEDFNGTISNTTMKVSFDANTSRELDWKFKPKQRSVTVRLGEKMTVFYVAENIGNALSSGTSTFNVSPAAAGQYFNKIECFCFTEQQLKPGERVEMPVLFFIDPAIQNDPLILPTTTITLSYTVYPMENSGENKVAELQ